MQNTPPVARGGFLWAVRRSFRVPGWARNVWGPLARRCELVKERFRAEEWTEWTPGVLEALGADEPTVPLRPYPMTVKERARILLGLGMDFARVAEVLQVSGEELLRVLPQTDGRVLLPSPRAYTSSAVERLKEASW